MRDYALQYYDGQVMDNLIRASQGRLILHVDLGTLQVQTKATSNGGINGGRTNVKNSSPTALLTTTITKPLNYSLGGGFEDQLTVVAQPQLDRDAVYATYLRFLCAKRNQRLKDVKTVDFNPETEPECLGVVTLPAKPAEAYVEGTYVEKNGKGYYIRADFRRAYFELCFAITGNVILGEIPQENSSKSTNGPSPKSKPLYKTLGPRAKPLDQALKEATRNEILLNPNNG